MDVYANSAGNRTIQILDAQGNTFADTTVFIPATGAGVTTTVTVNFQLYPGTNYFIKCLGFVDLYRNNAGANYPYIDNDIHITGSNAGLPGYYYFFYNWQYSEIGCNTSRTPCTATDTCALGINNLSADNMLEVYPNPNNGVFDLQFNTTTVDNYLVKITNTLGQVVYEDNLKSFSGTYKKKLNILI